MLTAAEINEAIQRTGGSWTAADTPFLARGMPTAKSGSLFGMRLNPGAARMATADGDMLDDLAAPCPPPRVDWRGALAGGRVTPVKDQTPECGSCVAFAVCAAMESAHWIDAGKQLSLSEAHLFFCNGGCCDLGWEIVPALDSARNGVGLEEDLPYSPTAACEPIRPALAITHYAAHEATLARKRAVARGPVVGGLEVFEDLLAYEQGIYRHVAGTESEGHAVCVVGYDDGLGCWIAKNSWSAGFGEQGFFRIAYGECGIDTSNPFYEVEVEAVT